MLAFEYSFSVHQQLAKHCSVRVLRFSRGTRATAYHAIRCCICARCDLNAFRCAWNTVCKVVLYVFVRNSLTAMAMVVPSSAVCTQMLILVQNNYAEMGYYHWWNTLHLHWIMQVYGEQLQCGVEFHNVLKLCIFFSPFYLTRMDAASVALCKQQADLVWMWIMRTCLRVYLFIFIFSRTIRKAVLSQIRPLPIAILSVQLNQLMMAIRMRRHFKAFRLPWN